LIATLEVSAPVGISFEVYVIATPIVNGARRKCVADLTTMYMFYSTASDFMVGLLNVAFEARQLKANVFINITDDNDLEPAEKFKLTFLILAGVSSLQPGNFSEATGVILNDDSMLIRFVFMDNYSIN